MLQQRTLAVECFADCNGNLAVNFHPPTSRHRVEPRARRFRRLRCLLARQPLTFVFAPTAFLDRAAGFPFSDGTQTGFDLLGRDILESLAKGFTIFVAHRVTTSCSESNSRHPTCATPK